MAEDSADVALALNGAVGDGNAFDDYGSGCRADGIAEETLIVFLRSADVEAADFVAGAVELAFEGLA